MSNTVGEKLSSIVVVSFLETNTPHPYEHIVISGTATETVPPTVSNVSPASGTAVQATQAISLDVTDAGGAGLRLVEIFVDQAGRREVVYDGAAFVAPYTLGSTVGTIANGFHFVIKRDGGWLSSPILRVRAIDNSWNQA